MRYPIQLQAGVPVKQFFRGRGLSIVSTGAAPEVSVKVFRSDVQDVEDFGGCDRNFSIFYADGIEFMGAEFSAAVDTVVEVIVSRARVTLQDGANVTATIDAAQLPLPVVHQGVAPTNRSGAVVAGIAEVAIPANAARRGFWVQNPSATADLWISEVGEATLASPSIKIPPGGMYESPYGGCPVGAISIVSSVDQDFTAREW